MIRRAIRLTLFLLVSLVSLTPASSEDAPAAEILRHSLTVDFHLPKHRLEAVDRMRVQAGDSGGALRLVLAPDLRVRRVEVAGKKQRKVKRDKIDGSFVVSVPAGESEVAIHYAGKIFDAVKKSGQLTFGTGGGMRGVIDQAGTYLSPGSHWIPEPKHQPPTHYDIDTTIDAPHLVVTQGDLASRGETNGRASASFKSAIPTHGVSLSAGRYVTTSRTVEGVTLSTYFFEKHADAQALWLDAAAETVKRYAKLLGPYPHKKFDIVESFFPTSHDRPPDTLLGADVIDGKIPPGYLDHQYVHGWFGNGLLVDYDTGNWCEALTTYYANYLRVERASKEKARAYRRGVLEKFSIRIKGDKDHPLRQFTTKIEDHENDIGYGKGAMLFHMIRKQIGDEVFFDTVKTFTKARMRTVVSWDDWLEAFDKASKSAVSDYVRPWLERKGLPMLAFHDVKVRPFRGEDSSNMAFQIRHTPPDDGQGIWPVRYRIDSVWTYHDQNRGDVTQTHETDRDVKEPNLMLNGIELGALVTAGTPSSITIDPDFDLLRRIPDEELPLCLNRTLETKGGVVVVKGPEEAFGELARHLAATNGFRVEGPDFDLAQFQGPAVVLEIAQDPKAGIQVGGKGYGGPNIAGLRSESIDGRLRTTYTATTPGAAARAQHIPSYGWDTWVVFEGGRPLARGTERADGQTHRLLTR